VYFSLSASTLEGESLPVSCNPTTSRSERAKTKSAAKKPLPKVMNARYLSGGKRSKDAIDIQQSAAVQEVYRPVPGSKCNQMSLIDLDQKPPTIMRLNDR